MFTRETYSRHKLNMKRLDDDAFEELRKTKRKGRYIRSTFNYDILSNQDYAEAFAYYNIASPYRGSDSDTMIQLLNLGERRNAQ